MGTKGQWGQLLDMKSNPEKFKVFYRFARANGPPGIAREQKKGARIRCGYNFWANSPPTRPLTELLFIGPETLG